MFAGEDYGCVGLVLKAMARLIAIRPMEPEVFAMVTSYDSTTSKLKHFTAVTRLMTPLERENTHNKLLPSSSPSSVPDTRALLAGSPSSAKLRKLMGTSGV